MQFFSFDTQRDSEMGIQLTKVILSKSPFKDSFLKSMKTLSEMYWKTIS